jgi:hypothetical protein
MANDKERGNFTAEQLQVAAAQVAQVEARKRQMEEIARHATLVAQKLEIELKLTRLVPAQCAAIVISILAGITTENEINPQTGKPNPWANPETIKSQYSEAVTRTRRYKKQVAAAAKDHDVVPDTVAEIPAEAVDENAAPPVAAAGQPAETPAPSDAPKLIVVP